MHVYSLYGLTCTFISLSLFDTSICTFIVYKECRSDLFPIEPEDEDPIVVDDPDDEFHTQEQEREEANDWRMEIANHMWRSRCKSTIRSST